MTDPGNPADRIFSVRGARALVTGAASGLGLAISEVLAESGASVTMVDVDETGLEEARATLAHRGADVRVHVANAESAKEIRDAVDGVVAEFGRIDVVFANAGVHRGVSFRSEDGFLERFPHDAWKAVIDLDLSGAFFTLQATAVHMKAQGSGRIIVTASTAGMRSDPRTGYAYVAAKSALINASRQAAFELAPFGVQVNVIAPGPFKTNIGGEDGRSAEIEAQWAATIPLGRMAEPSEIQGLALLLASNASSFMTGAVIAIDGGALTKQHPVDDQIP